MKKNFVIGACASLLFLSNALAKPPVNFDLTYNSPYNGNVVFNANWTDWVFFGNTQAVRKVGTRYIGDLVADGTFQSDNIVDGDICTSWTSGTPYANGTSNYYDKTIMVGSGYSAFFPPGVYKPCTYAKFIVIAPRESYILDIYFRCWGMNANLVATEGAVSETFPSITEGLTYRHVQLTVQGSTIGATNTIEFNSFSGNDTWGQVGIYSAGIAVPEPVTLGFFAAGMLVCLRKRKA